MRVAWDFMRIVVPPGRTAGAVYEAPSGQFSEEDEEGEVNTEDDVVRERYEREGSDAWERGRAREGGSRWGESDGRKRMRWR